MIDSRPTRIYCASKLFRAPMWREWKRELPPDAIQIVSTWHDSETVEADESVARICEIGWQANRMQILHAAEHVLVFGHKEDALQGTLIEIGMALAMDLPIHLVGTFPWGTWKFNESVHIHETLHDALVAILKGPKGVRSA